MIDKDSIYFYISNNRYFYLSFFREKGKGRRLRATGRQQHRIHWPPGNRDGIAFGKNKQPEFSHYKEKHYFSALFQTRKAQE
jgi:hypothetical protein